MSYCSIEEAWGAPFDAEPTVTPTSHRTSTGKPRRRRKRASRNASASAAYEGFANPSPPDTYHATNHTQSSTQPRVVTWGEQHWETPDSPHPDAHTRQFARELPSGQMPDALQVSLQGAPFAVENSGDGSVCAPAMTVVPDEVAAAARVSSDEGNGREPRTPEVETPAVSSSSPVIHEELDWMRNHLTHLTTQIETLSHKLDARATDDEGHANASGDKGGPATTTDAMLYVVTGAFALVLLDVLFRAGQRSAR